VQGVPVGAVVGGVLGGAVDGDVVLSGVVLGGVILGGVVLGLGPDEEDTPPEMGLVGAGAGQCRCPAPRHDGGPLEAETACMAGTAAQAVRADAAPMAATARTAWARENLVIGKQPFWSTGRLRYAHCGGGFRRFTGYVSTRKSCGIGW